MRFDLLISGINEDRATMTEEWLGEALRFHRVTLQIQES